MRGLLLHGTAPGRRPRLWPPGLIVALVLTAVCVLPAAGLAQEPENAPEEMDRLARPVDTGKVLDPIDLAHGLRFGLGIQQMALRSEELDLELGPTPPFSDGVLISLDALLGSFRLGYARRIYRRGLPANAEFDSESVDFLAFESDQIWAFHGFHVRHDLYLGYGFGLISRRYTLLRTVDGTPLSRTEAVTAVGLIADYAFAAPFSLQLRLTRDSGGRIVRLQGATLSLAYHLPY